MASQTRSVDNTILSDWINPDNAFTENDQCTAATTDGDQNVYNIINTPFTIPTGAAINGIEVKTIRATDENDYYEIELQDKAPAWLMKTGTFYFAVCADGAQETLGGSVDDWGGSWDATYINSSSFQIRLTYQKLQKANTPSVDHIEVVVYYTSITQQSITQTVSLTDSQYKSMFTPYTESTTLTDYIAKSISTIFTEVSTLFSDFNYSMFAQWSEDIYNAITLSDVYSVNMSTLYGETLPLMDDIDTISQFYRRKLDTLALQHFLSYVSPFKRYPLEAMNLWSDVSPLLSGQLQKAITQAIVLTHYLSYESEFYKSVLDSLSILDMHATGLYKSMIDTLTSPDYLTKKPSKSHDESLTIGDHIVKSAKVYVYQALTLFHDLDTVLSGALSKDILQAISLSDYLNYQSVFVKLLSVSLSLLDYVGTTLVGEGELLLTEAFGLFAGIFWPSQDYYKSLFNTLTMWTILSGTWDIYKPRESLTLEWYLMYYTEWLKRYTQSVNLAGYLYTITDFYRALSENITLLGYLVTSTLMYIDRYQSISIDDYLTKRYEIVKYLSQLLDITDYLIPTISGKFFQSLTQSITLLDYFTREIPMYRVLLQAINLTEYLSKSASIPFIDTLDLSYFLDSITQYSRLPTDAVTVSDYYTRVAQFSREIPQGVTVIDYIARSVTALRIQGMALSDILTKSVAVPVIDSLSIIDSYTLLIAPYLTQVITLEETLLPILSGVWQQSLTEAMSMVADLIKNVRIYRMVSTSLSDYITRRVDFVRVYHYDVSLTHFVITAWSTSVEFLQGLILDDPFYNAIFLTLLQMVESLTLFDVIKRLVPLIVKYTTVYLKDLTITVYTKKITTTVYTKTLELTLFIKRITATLVGKLRIWGSRRYR